MMTQSVMTQAANLAVSTKGSVISKQKQTSGDFSLLFGKSMKAAQFTAGKANTAAPDKTSADTAGKNAKTEVVKNNAASDNSDATTAQKNTEQTDSTADTSVKQPNVQKSGTQSDNTKVTDNSNNDNSKEDETPVNDQMAAQLLQMLQTVVQTVMDKLNLSKEEFNQLLANQNMNAADLLQPQNLQQFILASQGKTDIVAALTDENLANTMNQLLQSVDDVKSEFSNGLTPDQVQSILKQIQTLKEAKADAVMPLPTDEKAVPTSDDEPAKQSEAVSTAKTMKALEDKTSDSKTTGINEQKEVSVKSAKVETDTAPHSDSGNRNSENLNDVDKFQTFVDNLVKASQNAQSSFTDEIAQVTKLRDIANQIIDNIKVSVSTEQTSMQLQLNPESLGKVDLSVQSKEGIMTAHFVVQNEISKEAIESQLQTLKETLNQQGLKVEAIEVTVASYAFNQNNGETSGQQQEAKESRSGRHLSMEDALSMEDTDDKNSSEYLSGIRGNLVDYTA